MPEVDQLHQDLDGVGGHRPNLQQEIGGLDVRNLFNFNTQDAKNKFINRAKFNGKKVMNMTKILYFSGLALEY